MKKNLTIPDVFGSGTNQAEKLAWIKDSRDNLPAGVKLSDVFQVEPKNLKDHPLNEKLFKQEGPEYFDRLRADIQERGVLVPLIARRDGIILAGHNRLVIARELGLARVPVQYIDSPLNEGQETALLIKDNLYRRHFTQDDRLRLYRVLIPDFDEKIKAETRGGARGNQYTRGQGANGNFSRLANTDGLTANELTEKAKAAGVNVSEATAKKDLARARKKNEGKAPQARPPAADPLKTVKAHCARIVRAVDGANKKTKDRAVLELLDAIESIQGIDPRTNRNLRALQKALK